MSDLIRREDVLKAIWDWCCNREYAYTNATYWLQKRIESIPSAEREGKWLWSPRDTDGTVSGCCSECSFTHLFVGGHTAQYNFCPNCGCRMKGARMKGAEDE